MEFQQTLKRKINERIEEGYDHSLIKKKHEILEPLTQEIGCTDYIIDQFPWYQFIKIVEIYMKQNRKNDCNIELEIRISKYENINEEPNIKKEKNINKIKHFESNEFWSIHDNFINNPICSIAEISSWNCYKSSFQENYRLIEYDQLKKPLFEEKQRNLYCKDFAIKKKIDTTINEPKNDSGFILRSSISCEKSLSKPLQNPESVAFFKRKTIRIHSELSRFDYEISFSIVWRGETTEKALNSNPEHHIEIEFKSFGETEYEKWYIERGSQFQEETIVFISLILAGTHIKPLQKTKAIDFYDTKIFKNYSPYSFKDWLGNGFCQRFYDNSLPRQHIISKLQSIFQNDLPISSQNNQIFRFPGTLASNIVLEDLLFLKSNISKYKIFWKSDGLRGLLYFTKWKSNNLLIFINRAMDCFSIPCETIGSELYNGNIILDGELIENKNEIETFEFQIFDCLRFDNKSLIHKIYKDRMFEVDKILSLIKNCNCFKMIKKLPIENIKEIPNFKTDGFILLDSSSSYICGQNRFLFKWKNPIDNTIDFCVMLNKTTKHFELYLWDQKQYKLFAQYDSNELNCWKEWITVLEIHSNIIIECKWNIEKQIWSPLKLRIDKNIPNSIQVYNYTLLALSENIIESDIINLFF